ncbi:MAG: DUF3772 domain-containing protein [Pseudomonadota bacterium]
MTFVRLLLLALTLVCAGIAPVAVVAQQQQQSGPPDYEAWENVASRAEAAIERASASDEAFSRLRAEINGWRSQFQAQLNANDSRIGTLREQIAALGPAPEEGQDEAAEIAARRAELNEQLNRLTTPRRTAEEAFSRANGIISEIDTIIRTRQADKLLDAGPIPLNPTLWPQALADLNDSVGDSIADVRAAWNNPNQRTVAQDNLPVILLLAVLGIVLVVRSRGWMEKLAVRIARYEDSRASGVTGFVVSLGQILLPVAGLIALITAARVSGLYGPRGEVILGALVPMGLAVFLVRWLGSRIFPIADEVETPLGLDSNRRSEGRAYATLLGICFAVGLLFERLSDLDRFSPGTQAVLFFPLIVFVSLMTFRIGQLLRRHDPAKANLSAESDYRTRLIGLLGRILKIVALLATLLAAAGYASAAEMLIFPTVMSIALFGIVSLLQEVMRRLYVIVSRGDATVDGLIPTLLGLALIILSLPFLALIWGARVTDLTELWARARVGFSIGETTISPGSLLTLIVVFIIGYFLTRTIQGSMKSSVLPKTRLDSGGQTAVVSGLGYIGIFLSSIIAVTSAGIDLSNLAIVAGALSVGIGFGLQTVVSNFVSGIILLIERPISEGDWIEVGGQMGYVRDISVRSTRIETFDRTDVIVPNADLVSGTVTNYTRGNTVGRVIVPIGVAYGSDTRRIDQILREIAEAHPMVLANPAPMILFAGFGASSLDFEVRMIVRDVNWSLSVRNEINHQIAERFAEEGIEIPFAQRDVWLRNPEALGMDTGEKAEPFVDTPHQPKPSEG